MRNRRKVSKALSPPHRIIVFHGSPVGAKDLLQEILEILYNLNEEGNTLLVVTHDSKIARRCRRVIKIFDGLILEDSAVTPTTPFELEPIQEFEAVAPSD